MTPAKRHDVRSIIGGGGGGGGGSSTQRPSYPTMPPHLDLRTQAGGGSGGERGRYEEPKGRPSAVVSTASSMARASPIEQGPKSHHSPLGSYPQSSHRGSPHTPRDSGQRQHEGTHTLMEEAFY